MVAGDAVLRLTRVLFAVEEPAKPAFELLDPPRRAAVLMAILGLVLLGIVLVACVMIGGRWVRRLARHEHGPTKLKSHIENQRLRETLAPILPAGDTGETAVAERTGDDTVVDR